MTRLLRSSKQGVRSRIHQLIRSNTAALDSAQCWNEGLGFESVFWCVACGERVLKPSSQMAHVGMCFSQEARPTSTVDRQPTYIDLSRCSAVHEAQRPAGRRLKP